MNTLKEDMWLQALHVLEEEQEFYKVELTNDTLTFLGELTLNRFLLDFFANYSFNDNLDFNGNCFNAVNDMVRENLHSSNKLVYKLGYLIIGAGLNGDPIALNLNSLTICFLDHELLWPEDTLESLEGVYADTKLSLGEFFYRSLVDEEFPHDASEVDSLLF